MFLLFVVFCLFSVVVVAVAVFFPRGLMFFLMIFGIWVRLNELLKSFEKTNFYACLSSDGLRMSLRWF